ncbi:MAG TPA: hypothetical protein VFZ81_06100 [Burkholderiales bacterium]
MRLILLFLLVPLLAWAEPATVIRATELKKSPATDAPTVAELAENTGVDALERRGGWTRVKAAAGEGWVKMLALRYGSSAARPGGDSGVIQLLNVARTGSSGTQVTTGVRGLEAEQIANAEPNAAELKKMQKFAASPDAAAKFAAQGRLQAVAVEEPQ